MIDFLASLLSGGLTGIVGSLATGLMSYFKQKEINRHTIEMRKLDMQLAQMQIDSEKDIANIDKEKAIETEEVKAFRTSMSDTTLYAGETIRNHRVWGVFYMLLDFIRGGLRPVMTIYLVVLTTYIYNDLQAMLGQQAIPVEEAIEIVRYIINAIVYLTMTVILWWFGTRLKEKWGS